jgi:hypothetical protein
MKNQNLIFAALIAATFADEMRAAPTEFCAKMRSCIVCSAENPAAAFPTFVTGLNKGLSAQRGGISWVALMKCEVEFTDIEDVVEWNAKIASGDIIIIQDCYLTGGKTTEANTVTLGSCRINLVTDRNHTVTLADIADNTDYDRSTLWLHTQTYPNDYKMAYATCDGVLYPFNSVQINANKNIDDTTEGFTRWDVTITNSKLTNDMPVMLTAGTTIADIIYPTPTP